MGADQIGFLFKGPLRLKHTKATIHAAEQRAAEVLQALRTLQHQDELPDVLPSALRHLTRGDVEEAVCFVDTLPEPAVAVANLLEWWDNGARDTATRNDPDNRARIIGFAGDRSWGDEPDGFGYTTYKAALYLDILRVFDIK